MKTSVFFCLGILGFCSCSSESDFEKADFQSDDNDIVICAFNFDGLEDSIAALDVSEHLSVPVTVENRGSLTRATPPIVATGNIENIGNRKTVWKYGVGANLVPQYLCGTNVGQTTVSTVYKISVTFERTPDITYDVAYEGEYRGWDSTYIYNSQTPWQNITSNSDMSRTIYTYCYDIIATIGGSATPGGHFWVPYEKDKIRIYAKRFIEG